MAMTIEISLLERLCYDSRVEAIFREVGDAMVGEKVRVCRVDDFEFEHLIGGEELTIQSVQITDTDVLITFYEYEGAVDMYYVMFYNDYTPILELVNHHQLLEDVFGFF